MYLHDKCYWVMWINNLATFLPKPFLQTWYGPWDCLLRSLLACVSMLMLTGPASPPWLRQLTWFGHRAARRRLLRNRRKPWRRGELVGLNRRIRHRGLETLQRGERCRGPRCGHQTISRTRPSVKPSLRAYTRMQLPQRSCIRSCGHFQLPKMPASL